MAVPLSYCDIVTGIEVDEASMLDCSKVKVEKTNPSSWSTSSSRASILTNAQSSITGGVMGHGCFLVSQKQPKTRARTNADFLHSSIWPSKLMNIWMFLLHECSPIRISYLFILRPFLYIINLHNKALTKSGYEIKFLFCKDKLRNSKILCMQ